MEYRSYVCLLCFKKGNIKITEKLLNLIRQHADGYEGYSSSEVSLSCVLCSTCRNKLYKGEHIPYASLGCPTSSSCTRSHVQLEATGCECQMCKIGHMNCYAYKSYLKTQSSTKCSSTRKICPICFSAIYQGCRHVCNKKKQKANIAKLKTHELVDIQ